VEGKTVLFALVDGNAGDVGRQQVAGELDPVELQAQRQGQRVRQRGLADPGHVVDEEVAAGQQAGQREAHLAVLADHDLADLARRRVQFVEHDAFLSWFRGGMRPPRAHGRLATSATFLFQRQHASTRFYARTVREGRHG
jgi:hypothetical protein